MSECPFGRCRKKNIKRKIKTIQGRKFAGAALAIGSSTAGLAPLAGARLAREESRQATQAVRPHQL